MEPQKILNEVECVIVEKMAKVVNMTKDEMLIIIKKNYEVRTFFYKTRDNVISSL